MLRRFAQRRPELPSALVIVPGAGLVPPETIIDVEQLRAIAEIPVAEDNPNFRDPLLAAAKLLDDHAGRNCSYVLLGSVASAKIHDSAARNFRRASAVSRGLCRPGGHEPRRTDAAPGSFRS